MRARRPLGSGLVLLALVAGLAMGCAKSAPRERVWIPPRVDLARWGTIGMIEFSAGGAPGLAPLASREFLAALQAAQPGTPVLELPDESRVLAEIGGHALDPETIRAIGERYRVDSLVVGRIETRQAVPNVAFDSGLRWVTASAELQGGLDARIFETASGATLWTRSAHATAPLAHLDVSTAGVSGVGAADAGDAQLHLVRNLAARATADFWGTWD